MATKVYIEIPETENQSYVKHGDLVIINRSQVAYLIVQIDGAKFRIVNLQNGNRFSATDFGSQTTLRDVSSHIGYSVQDVTYVPRDRYSITIKGV